MRRWFLSYHSPDQALAERLKAAIELKDSSARVFFAPTHLRAGASWSAQLAQEIADADAFILLVGEAGVGNWQVPEYDEALDKWVSAQGKFPLVVVLLEGQTAPGLQFIRRLHWIVSSDPASEKDIGRLFDAAAGGGSTPGELWRYTSPYRGLEAMEEKDSDYFFGRGEKIVEVIRALQATPDKLLVLLGNSGVGKSSLAQAGALAALLRQGWPESVQGAGDWPAALNDSRRWCFLKLRPGAEPLRALVAPFLQTWQFDAVDPKRAELLSDWTQRLRAGTLGLRDLLDATQARYRDELRQPAPPAFLLYVDQAEELYMRAPEPDRRRFSEMLAQAAADPRLRMTMSMRSDFFGQLQKDEAMFAVHRQINVPPLREAQLREVVSKPPAALSARFESPGLIEIITQQTAKDAASEVGALPLLSYTLDDMWTQMVARKDGILRLSAASFAIDGVLVERASAFLAAHVGSESALRRIFTLRCATVREDGEPTRRRAFRSEFSAEEWRLVSELADHPNRLLVTASTESGETYAEVAHEAIFRRWNKLREWIAAEREFLAWRSGLELARKSWEATPDASKPDALLMGAAFTQAQDWFTRRAEDLPAPDREFIARSIVRDNEARARARIARATIYGLGAAVILVLLGWINQTTIADGWRFWTITRPYARANVQRNVLSAAQERALKPGQLFKECRQDCPDMIVIPAGSFTMGGPFQVEQPQHTVTFARPFAVSKYELTFADWDACVAGGGCSGYEPSDQGWGRGRRPVINIDWNEAQAYVAWLSLVTGKTYRLLSEAEYEYATRAGAPTKYPWGDDIKLNGQAMANCDGCGSQWDGKQTAPVGSFPPNKFGLYDMVGNVFEWTEDCEHPNYHGAPADGSAWLKENGGDCTNRSARGGSWLDSPDLLQSAPRFGITFLDRFLTIGFRVARTLNAP